MNFRNIMRQSILSGFIIILFSCAAKKGVDSGENIMVTEKRTPNHYYLWAFKPNINVRKNSSVQSEKLEAISDGDSVIVLSIENSWYKVRTESGQTGWIRSDLLGPKSLSAFSSAVTYADSLKENHDIDLYFDKNVYHKRIYLSFPDDYYFSKNRVEELTREIVKSYQQHVYRGEVTARVLKPGTQNEFFTKTFSGEINADPVLPLISFGQILRVENTNPQKIALYYTVPDEISDENLLLAARNISAAFPISYQSVEVSFLDNSVHTEHNCRLWYKEDQNGEDYKFSAHP